MTIGNQLAVPVGVGGGCGNKRYEHLLQGIDLFGRPFWLNGQVRSGWYTAIDYNDIPGADLPWDPSSILNFPRCPTISAEWNTPSNRRSVAG